MSSFYKSKTKPLFFPNNKWPLLKGVRIIAELETFPPVFLLSNGEKIQGARKQSSKTLNRSKSKIRRKSLKSRKHKF